MLKSHSIFHQFLLLRDQTKSVNIELAEDPVLCLNWIALCLVPVLEHALSNQPQLAIAHMMRPVAVTTKQVWGVLNIDTVVNSSNNLPDMVTLLRLVGPHHN